MPLTYRDQNETISQVSNRWTYPPNCYTPVIVEEYSNGRVRFRHEANYEKEHRVKPADPLLFPTSREPVYRRYGEAPLNAVSITYYPCPHSGIHGNVKLEGFHTGDSSLYTHPTFSQSSLMQQKLWASKLRNKIGVTKVNLGSSLAEYRESVKMFVSFAKTLRNAYNVVKLKHTRKPLKVCSVPAAVLQYNFGVAPLVNDLYSSVEQLRFRMNETIVRRLSVGIKMGRDVDFTSGPYDYSNVDCLYKERAVISYKLNPDQYLSQDFDFGNPVEWAWELIPFSFVVDWGIPIGEWLGQIDALNGVSDIVGTVTTRSRYRWNYTSNVVNYTQQPGYFHSNTYQRDVITSVPLPPFPNWSPSLSWKRAINATSILLGMSKPCRQGR